MNFKYSWAIIKESLSIANYVEIIHFPFPEEFFSLVENIFKTIFLGILIV
jgi:hypothetical protein